MGAWRSSDEEVSTPHASDPPPWGPCQERARFLGRGEAILDLLPLLRRATYGEQDLAVVFDCLDFTNRQVMDFIGIEDPRAMVTCFALAHEQHRPLDTNTDGAQPSFSSTRPSARVPRQGCGRLWQAFPGDTGEEACEGDRRSHQLVGQTDVRAAQLGPPSLRGGMTPHCTEQAEINSMPQGVRLTDDCSADPEVVSDTALPR